MSNNYFQFKQFTVQQDKCAMKVCTDACLFGAWAASILKEHFVTTLLDIGTGTGLLSLMLAQQLQARIETVEIDGDAFIQANSNFRQSPWQNRLTAINKSILDFYPGKKYDCIISNPPFFENDLKSPGENKNAAKHSSTLTLEELLNKTRTLLAEGGLFAVLLPYHRTGFFISACEQQGLYCKEKILVKQTPAHTYFRSMLLFSSHKTAASEKEITIKENDGSYSMGFSALLKDYYLYL